MQADFPPNDSLTSKPRSLAVVGCAGFNCTRRVAPALEQCGDGLDITGYDLKTPKQGWTRWPFVRVKNSADLERKLLLQDPTDILIETTDRDHLEHIQLALRSGARRVFCEKAVAARSADLAAYLPFQKAHAGQQIWIADHYMLLALALRLLAKREQWLGEVRFLKVILLEKQGVPAEQVKSHALGLGPFFHHALALAAAFMDWEDLELVDSSRARHPNAPIPDTFRAARYRSRRRKSLALECAVGKYMPADHKQIIFEGTKGIAILDRNQGELRVIPRDGAGEFRLHAPGDMGYSALARAIASGTDLPCLLSVDTAVQILDRLEQAHQQAREVPIYSGAGAPDFFSGWQLPSAA